MRSPVRPCYGAETIHLFSRFDLASEPASVNLLLGIGGQNAQRDSRVRVVEPAADPLAIPVENIDHAPVRHLRSGLLDHLLEDPRMGGSTRNFEFDLRKFRSDHESARKLFFLMMGLAEIS